MNRVEKIRAEEKKYHDACYDTCALFEQGSWLHKPVKTVLDSLEQFEHYDFLHVLDLGCGIGRNSIPIAETMRDRDGKVVCVDLLKSAINGLNQYSTKYGVERYIDAWLSDIDDFAIEPVCYDLIVAVSTLEHVRSEAALALKLREMARGTKPNGVNCIIIGSSIREVAIGSNRELDVMFEVNLPTDAMLALLDSAYEGWEIQSRFAKHLEFEIERDGQPVQLTTECITYVAKNAVSDL